MKEMTFGYLISSFLSGFLFALGLGISGMTQPKNVQAFLNVTGDWNPALLIVMATAMLLYFFANIVARRMSKPLLDRDWSELPKTGWDVSPQMLIGNVLFGIGWGLVGYCPGPALVSFVTLKSPAIVFVTAMVSGFFIWEFALKKLCSRPKWLHHTLTIQTLGERK